MPFEYLIKQERIRTFSAEEYKNPSFIIQTPFMPFMATLLFCFIILLTTTQFKLTSAISIHDSAISNCPTKCGNVDMSLPFGIGEGCFLDEGFEVICNQSIPYLSSSNQQLLEILPHEVRVSSKNFIAKICSADEDIGQAMIQLPEESPFTISNTKNILVNIGCHMLGSATTSQRVGGTRCKAVCPRNERIVNGSCNGIGCCQTSLPPVRKNLVITVEQFNPGITNCSYGFVVENGTYIFTESDLLDFNTAATISMRLEWSVGKGNNCSTAKRFLCGVNTQCHDSEDEYFCTCLQGYEGTPTLYGPHGCQG